MNNIYIDGLALVDGHFSGVGQYTLGMLRGLDAILEERALTNNHALNIKIIIPYDSKKHVDCFGFKFITTKKYPITYNLATKLWINGKLPPIDLWCGKGKYIFPRFVDMPLKFSESNILTIFDLSYELYKQYSEERNAKFMSTFVKDSIKRTKAIVAISENAKKEIIKFYKVPSSMVKVATPAVDQTHFYRRSDEEINKTKLKYGIKAKNYILALSNLEPRKNLESLVDCYCELPEKLRKDTALLLVGVNGWKADKLFKKILEKVEEGFNILRPNEYVSDSDKPAIISGASMLVYPSHYEGFGIPPLEALACGVPVITSNNSSLPEVVGNAGIMVPSNNKKKLYKAMIDYLENIENYTKKAIIEGPERASQFSWKKSAKDILKAI